MNKWVMVLVAMLLVVEVRAATLLTNGAFKNQDGGSKQNALGWIESGCAGREEWAGRNTGGYGMAMKCWDNEGTGEAFQLVKVSSSEYVYKIWACRDPGDVSGEFFMKIIWYKGSDFISESIKKLTLTSGWTQYTLTAKAPVGADKAKISFGSAGISLTGKFTEASLE